MTKTCATTLFALLLLAACSAPKFNLFQQGQPWQILQPAEGDLYPEAGKQAAGYLFDVSAEGEFYATLNLQNPSAVYSLVLMREGQAQAVATAPGRAGQPTRITAARVTPGKYGIAVVANAGQSRYTLDTAFKPNDPVAKSKFPSTMQAGPLQLGAAVTGKVSWASQEQAHYYKVTVPADGTLKTRVQAKAGKPSVAVVDAAGMEQVLSVPAGSKEVKAGDVFVKVFAADIVDFADYQLIVDFEGADCNANSGDDGEQDGAIAIALPGTAKEKLDFDKGDCIDWYKVEPKEKGKLGVWCRGKTKGVKVMCEVVKPGGDSGPRSTGSTWAIDVEPGVWFIKAYVDDKGANTQYDISTTFVPALSVTGDVLEIEGSPSAPKAIIISAGRNKGVVTGMMGTIKCADQPIGSAAVDQVYPDVAKVKVLSLNGKFDPSCKVVVGQ